MNIFFVTVVENIINSLSRLDSDLLIENAVISLNIFLLSQVIQYHVVSSLKKIKNSGPEDIYMVLRVRWLNFYNKNSLRYTYSMSV